jgi:hypothetical protein
VLSDRLVEHVLPPEYHGDPLGKARGCLSYQTFGRKTVDELRGLGFGDAAAFFFLVQ